MQSNMLGAVRFHAQRPATTCMIMIMLQHYMPACQADLVSGPCTRPLYHSSPEGNQKLCCSSMPVSILLAVHGTCRHGTVHMSMQQVSSPVPCFALLLLLLLLLFSAAIAVLSAATTLIIRCK